MTTVDVIGLMVPVTFLVMLGLEQLGTGRNWPRIPWWRTTGLIFLILALALNVVLPELLPHSLTQHHLINGAALGLIGGTVVGYMMSSFLNAVLHRAYHRYPFLWRFVHALHHSPQRMDISGGLFLTPWETTGIVVITTGVTVFVLGLEPVTAALVGYVAAFWGLFQHFNIRTPRWLGYIIERPESHSVHHRRGFHAYNYSDLPLWDIVWGTFRNPERYNGDVGFEYDESRRLGAMLVGKDVNSATLGPGNRGRTEPASNPA